MKFTEVLDTIKLVIESREVPLVIGESGIGKTALAHRVAKEYNYHLVTIDANLLKEGEIGGLPTVINGFTVYATHHKLAEISEAVKKGEEVLLFIDELNRCDHAVQQELMNLILNREINGYKLDKGVNIAFDTIGKNNYQPDENRVKWLRELCLSGYSNQIVMSVDITRKSHFKENGGIGYSYLIDTFVPMLLKSEIKDKHIENMLVNNIKRIYQL